MNQPARVNPSKSAYTPVRAPRGPNLSCLGWHQEAALRMLMNSLDEEVAEQPREMIVCGAAAKPILNWDCFHATVQQLKRLKNNETLLVLSGQPAGMLQTQEAAPRVVMVNSSAIPGWAPPDKLREIESRGIKCFPSAEVEGWTCLGAQGNVERTFEILATVARKQFGGNLAGKLIASGGMGSMGGALSLAATLHGAAFLGIEVNPGRIKRRIRAGYCDYCVNNLDEALRILKNAVRQKQPVSVGLVGNCAEIIPEMASRGVVPDILSDQTGADDLLNGYIPAGLSLELAGELRRQNPEDYVKRAGDSTGRHVKGMLELQKLGAVTFELANNIRATAYAFGGVTNAFDFPDVDSAYIQSLVSEAAAPVRCVALSGNTRDIYRVDDLLLDLFPDNADLSRWIRLARKHMRFQGLPARTYTLNPKERAIFGERLNGLAGRGELTAPMVVARDETDRGAAVSSLLNSAEIKDASDSVINQPMLHALLDSAAGASWVSFHSCGSMDANSHYHASYATLADGTPSAAERLHQILRDNHGSSPIHHAV